VVTKANLKPNDCTFGVENADDLFIANQSYRRQHGNNKDLFPAASLSNHISDDFLSPHFGQALYFLGSFPVTNGNQIPAIGSAAIGLFA